MFKLKRLPPSWWVMLAVWIVAINLLVANFVFRWELPWLLTVLVLAPFVSTIYSMRLMWKQTDHPAFHPSKPGSDSTPKGK